MVEIVQPVMEVVPDVEEAPVEVVKVEASPVEKEEPVKVGKVEKVDSDSDGEG